MSDRSEHRERESSGASVPTNLPLAILNADSQDDVDMISRWLKLADQVLADPEDRKRA